MIKAHKSAGLRIASYNIRKAKGLDQRRDPHRIIHVLNSLDADLIALQEADRRLGNRPAAVPRHLIATETDFEVAELATNDVSLGWHGNAMLVRKGLPITDNARISLTGLEPRGAVSVTVLGITFIGVHLGLLRRFRNIQLGQLADATRQLSGVVIMGDFNEWSPKRGLEPLLDQFQVHKPGATFHAARPIAALDRIALSKELALKDAGVAQSQLARKASDHLPIWADITTVDTLL